VAFLPLAAKAIVARQAALRLVPSAQNRDAGAD
jgi:hypothetical protein